MRVCQAITSQSAPTMVTRIVRVVVAKDGDKIKTIRFGHGDDGERNGERANVQGTNCV